ncbi:sensor histidine kinase [Arenibaculum sp.]|uniref:sensor histidine kinase n=1 Tax=Arenibaculum sp. TaxID=2865862 RepID=UPI002E121E2B|nr:MEDS domain-containing protein [Arenibaculum sp.]
MTAFVDSGIPAVGQVRWGTHFCQFYETAADLVDTLVPYFKAGLENNEQCLWVAARPLGAEEAGNALRAAVPDLDRRQRRGQIQIVDAGEWYLRDGKKGADILLDEWLALKDRALENGYLGLRATGNTYFLEAGDWDSFAEYETKVNACFCDHRVIALCSYCTQRCNAGGVLDVVENHEFALARRRGAWTLLESSALKQAKEELRRVNGELETRVAERTSALSVALDETRRAAAEKDVLLQEVHHRVKNNLQIVNSLLMLKARRSRDPALREAFEDTLRRVTAMSLVHEALYQHDDTSGIEFAVYLRTLGAALTDSFGVTGRIAVEVGPAEGRLDLNTAVPVGLIAAEAIANALKHAFPAEGTGRIEIRFRAPGGGEEGELVVRDDGRGIGDADASGTGGSGLALVKAIARQVGGGVSIETRGGTEFRLSFGG